MAGRQAVGLQHVIQSVFRRGAFAGGIEGLARQICHAVHSIAVFHDVQHAQRVQCGQLHVAARLVVEHGGHVGGNGCDVEFPLDHLARDLIGRTGYGEFIGVLGLALFGIGHQFHHADGSGAAEGRYPDGHFLLWLLRRGVRWGAGLFGIGVGFALCLVGAAGQGKQQHEGQQKG